MRRPADRMATVLRVRKVQQDVAAAARQRAELSVAEEEARFAAREADLRHPWSDRAIVELAFEAIDRATVGLAEAEAMADHRRLEHVSAGQRARAIERLVERRRAEAAADENRKAALVLDDLALTRHSRRKRR